MSDDRPDTDGAKKKRRRKRTGLRVPSDNVPRRADDDDDLTPPPSDDPRLAVSLASAFGAGEVTTPPPSPSSSAVNLEALASERSQTTGDSVEIAFEEDDDSGRGPAEAGGNGVSAALPAVDADADFDDAHELDEVEDIEDVSDEVDLVGEAGDDADEAPTRVADLPLPTVPADAIAGGKHAGDDDSRATQVMPALTEEDVARAVAEAEAAARAKSQSEITPPPVEPASERMMPPPDDSDGAPELLSEDADASVTGDTLKGPPVTGPVAHAVGARIEPGDASDSGEMLTDDLIEEFEQSAETVQLSDADVEVTPVPAPPPATAAPAPPEPAPQREEPVVEATGPVVLPSVSDYASEGRAETVLEPVEEISAAEIVEVESSEATEEPVSADAPTDPVLDSGPPAQAPSPPTPAPPKAVPPPPKPAPVTVRPKPPPAPPCAAAPSAAAAAPAATPKRRKGKPWFEEIFDEDYLRTLPFLTPQQTQRQARFVIDALAVEPGGQLLDVGCGYGRHAMELAARGYHVVGLDSSLPLLIRGADEAQRRGLTINFVHGDMRELTFEDQFDGAYCLFGTFGYFDDETNKKAAQGIARSLKPGARFVVEVLNRDYLVGDLPSRVWWEGDGCVVLEEVEFNFFSSRVNSSRSVVFDDGRQLEQEISIRAYSLHEMGKLLHAAGFRILEVSGSMDTKGRFFGAHSREIVVVAERRGAAKPASTQTAADTGDSAPAGAGSAPDASDE